VCGGRVIASSTAAGGSANNSRMAAIAAAASPSPPTDGKCAATNGASPLSTQRVVERATQRAKAGALPPNRLDESLVHAAATLRPSITRRLRRDDRAS